MERDIMTTSTDNNRIAQLQAESQQAWENGDVEHWFVLEVQIEALKANDKNRMSTEEYIKEILRR